MNEEPFTIIHIGKCGGSSVSTILNKHNIQRHKIHVAKPNFHSNRKYVIVIRNPIQRFISAFNWRYKLVVLEKSQENKFAGEKALLTKYASVNNLAENISEFNIHKNYIHHIKEDIFFHIGKFLEKCTKENILGIITTENLLEEVNQLFGLQENIHAKNNTTVKDKYISDVGYKNLKNYLKKDYDCIDKLFAMGCLTQEQYNVLSK